MKDSRIPSAQTLRAVFADLQRSSQETRDEYLSIIEGRIERCLPEALREAVRSDRDLIETYIVLLELRERLKAGEAPTDRPEAEEPESAAFSLIHPDARPCQQTEQDHYLSVFPLVVSQECYRGPIRKFHAWRTCIGALVGIALPQFEHSTEGITVHLPPPLTGQQERSPLVPLLGIELDGGTLTYEQCSQLLPALRDLTPHLAGWQETTRQFLAGLQRAIATQQGITFTMGS